MHKSLPLTTLFGKVITGRDKLDRNSVSRYGRGPANQGDGRDNHPKQTDDCADTGSVPRIR